MAAKEEALLEELMELEDKVAKKRAKKPDELKTEWIKKQRILVEEDAHALIQVCQYSLASFNKSIYVMIIVCVLSYISYTSGSTLNTLFFLEKEV